jgi:hydroxymethylpyrimidine pyrophosphatase-like HAD family hydrolase
VLDFASGHTLYERRLPRDAARGALGLARRVADVQPLLYTRDRVFAERRHPLADAYALDDGLSYEIVPSLDVLLDVDPYKLLVIGPSERVDTLQGTVRQAGLPVHAVKSEPVYLEILPPGVSKGTALLAMGEILGIPSSSTIAVGDNWNDLEMIEAAGLGVAMRSAPAGVRARADHVCGTAEEEGVREVIERFLVRGA